MGRGCVTASMRAGDLVLFGVYTMHGFLTNQCAGVRVSAESKWFLEGDGAGPDERYCGHRVGGGGGGVGKVMSLEEAKRTVWGL